MICRTLRPRSAWSCATNMYWDTDQAITSTTPGGAKLKSNCTPPRVSRPSRFTLRPGITRRLTKTLAPPSTVRFIALLLLSLAVFAGRALAQIPVTNTAPPPPPGQQPTPPQGTQTDKQGRIIANVNLVVLHTSVLCLRIRWSKSLPSSSAKIFPSVWDS
jgi:hypothetical protein